MKDLGPLFELPPESTESPESTTGAAQEAAQPLYGLSQNEIVPRPPDAGDAAEEGHETRSSRGQLDVNRITQEGIECCRRGQWKRGFELVRSAARCRGAALPAVAFAYLGYGVAHFDDRYEDGLALCEQALVLDLFEPENYLLLAMVYMLRADRASAIDALRRGLRISKGNPGLLALLSELSPRRKPAVPNLPRTHPVNRILGRLRHRLYSLARR